jgi:hypothetical protein
MSLSRVVDLLRGPQSRHERSALFSAATARGKRGFPWLGCRMTLRPGPRGIEGPGRVDPATIPRHREHAMTYEPAPHTDPPSTPPTGTHRRLWLALGAAALVVVAVVVAALVVRGGFSEQSAQRECRTAMEREARNRASDGLTRSVVFAVQGVDIEETSATDNGYAVNGVVRYTITAALVPPVEASLSLTCEATDAGGKVSTSVKNRA